MICVDLLTQLRAGIAQSRKHTPFPCASDVRRCRRNSPNIIYSWRSIETCLPAMSDNVLVICDIEDSHLSRLWQSTWKKVDRVCKSLARWTIQESIEACTRRRIKTLRSLFTATGTLSCEFRALEDSPCRRNDSCAVIGVLRSAVRCSLIAVTFRPGQLYATQTSALSTMGDTYPMVRIADYEADLILASHSISMR